MNIKNVAFTRRNMLLWMSAVASYRILPAIAAEPAELLPQPYFAEVSRAIKTLAQLGRPLSDSDTDRIATLALQSDRLAVAEAEAILDRYTLARLSIDAAGNVGVAAGAAQKSLIEQGWSMFLVRMANPSGVKDTINFSTGWYYKGTPSQMLPGTGSFRLSQQGFLLDTLNNAALLEKMWLQSELHGATPVAVYGMEVPVVELSGYALEYYVLQLYSRDQGQRSSRLSLTTFPGGGAVGDTASRDFNFDIRPSRPVRLRVVDFDGRGCVAALTIKDSNGHIYPSMAMRLAPDMYFQEHVYRADGEIMRLPDGEYIVESWRGPEYVRGRQTAIIDRQRDLIDVELERWIDPAAWGWYSGDPHIHAGGCLHYQIPTEGVSPETMIRHVRGEGLSIGDVLSWGPSWYYQKQFFSGSAQSPPSDLEHPDLQAAVNATLQPRATPTDHESLLRYDVEVSGFPSSHAGHLVLLRLKVQDYPGTERIEDWPSWNLPILQWAREQGAVAGYAHCGLGMVVDSEQLPNYEIPPMDGVGTQEAIIDVTHGVVDFLCGCDTNPVAELNAWYHMLNCGFRLGFLGETDFPCLTGERVGCGRTYVQVEQRPIGDAGYESWVRNLQQGQLYAGDGRSHFLKFSVNGQSSGAADVELSAPGTVVVKVLVAARLEPEITPETEALRTARSAEWVWGWHLEKARLGASRDVAVELVVNGIAVDKVAIVADGTLRELDFRVSIERSSWVAVRIMPSGHTHPIFVCVEDKPVRASRRSAQWCRMCVDKVWEVKSPFIRANERPAAAQAFDHARSVYDAILSESEAV